VTGIRVGHVGLLLGGTVSVAANVLHATLGGGAGSAEVVAAACWPLILLVAVEVAVRTPWPAGPGWRAVQVGGLGLTGAMAALVSWSHMAGLLSAWDGPGLAAGLGPVAVDGLMVMSAAALWAVRSGPVEESGPDRVAADQPAGPDRTAVQTVTDHPTGLRSAPVVITETGHGPDRTKTTRPDQVRTGPVNRRADPAQDARTVAAMVADPDRRVSRRDVERALGCGATLATKLLGAARAAPADTGPTDRPVADPRDAATSHVPANPSDATGHTLQPVT
jgi:hypothetical protein